MEEHSKRFVVARQCTGIENRMAGGAPQHFQVGSAWKCSLVFVYEYCVTSPGSLIACTGYSVRSTVESPLRVGSGCSPEWY